MGQRGEWKMLAGIGAVLLAAYVLPVESGWFDSAHHGRFVHAAGQSVALVHWYARQHALSSLLPALILAGTISVFIPRAAVMKFLSASAGRVAAYLAAAFGGPLLAACSCTVLPLFAGMRRLGGGLGPACTFLYAAPAINMMAVIFTARVLGGEMAAARAVGAVVFGLAIGLAMQAIFRKSELVPDAAEKSTFALPAEGGKRKGWQTLAVLACLGGVMIFADWSLTGQYRVGLTCCPGGKVESYMIGTEIAHRGDSITFRDLAGQDHVVPAWQLASVERAGGGAVFNAIHDYRFAITALLAAGLAAMLMRWSGRGELGCWLSATLDLSRQILPLLLAGVLAAGFLLGQGSQEGIIPARAIGLLIGQSPDAFLAATGWSGHCSGAVRFLWPLWTNLFASIFGALTYFATLTEVPIVQGLVHAGMGKGPALALLLAGPALSLPTMLALGGVLGARKTAVYCGLVVAMATVSGLAFGAFF